MTSPENKYFVYALIDPVNDAPFYFGKGSGNRPMHHLNGKDRNNKAKCRMIDTLRILGLEPKIAYVDTNLSEAYAYELETFCINEARKFPTFVITNATGLRKPPSRKGCVVSAETRAKISATTKGRKGKPVTEEAKEKIRRKLSGAVRTDEFKEKVSHGLKKAWSEGRFVRK